MALPDRHYHVSPPTQEETVCSHACASQKGLLHVKVCVTTTSLYLHPVCDQNVGEVLGSLACEV